MAILLQSDSTVEQCNQIHTLQAIVNDKKKEYSVSLTRLLGNLRHSFQHELEYTESLQLTRALKLISSLYAVIVVLLGLIFPASEALRDSWLETYYNGIFLVYVYAVATAFLIFLQAYIIPFSNKKSKKREELYDAAPPNAWISKNISYESTYQGDILANINKEGPSNDLQTSLQSDENSSDENEISIGTTGLNQSPNEIVWKRNEENTSTSNTDENDHEGSSFYLRLGVLFFGIGNMIYVALEIDYRLVNVPEGCPTDKFGWTFVLKLVFLVIQTFFLFKNPMVHVTVCKRIYDFGCKHLIATNLCIWIRTLISEIEEAFLHSGHSNGEHAGNYATTTDNNTCYTDGELIFSARPYLFPFVLEYSLIAMGVFAVMTNGIRHIKMPHRHHLRDIKEDKNKESIEDIENIETSSTDSSEFETNTSSQFGPMQVKKRGVVSMNFKNANKGVFLGVLVLAGAIVAIILFFFEANDKDIEGAQMNYLISDIILHLFMIAAIVYSIFALRKLKMKHIHIQVDDILLLIAMSGSFLFEMSIVISCSVYLSEDQKESITSLSLISAVISLVQTVLQTILITNGLRRTSVTEKQHEEMPGRETITFLIVCNVTVWIFRMFQVKELEMGIQEEFYGTLAWLFLLNLNLPLLLFFHFHSSVCLADIWTEAYTLKSPSEIERNNTKVQMDQCYANAAFNIEVENNLSLNKDTNNNSNNNKSNNDNITYM